MWVALDVKTCNLQSNRHAQLHISDNASRESRDIRSVFVVDLIDLLRSFPLILFCKCSRLIHLRVLNVFYIRLYHPEFYRAENCKQSAPQRKSHDKAHYTCLQSLGYQHSIRFLRYVQEISDPMDDCQPSGLKFDRFSRQQQLSVNRCTKSRSPRIADNGNLTPATSPYINGRCHQEYSSETFRGRKLNASKFHNATLALKPHRCDTRTDRRMDRPHAKTKARGDSMRFLRLSA